MSSIHLEIENFGDYAEVRDHRSTNKTWLNNQVVATSRLNNGDMIRAGKTHIAVQWEGPANDVAEVPDTLQPALDSRDSFRKSDPGNNSSPMLSSSAFKQNPPVEQSSVQDIRSADSMLPPSPASVDDFPLSFADSQPATPFRESKPFVSDTGPRDSNVSSFGGSPLDSSSLFGAPVSFPVSSKVSQDFEYSNIVMRFRQTKANASQYDIGRIITRLAEREPVSVVVHFQKIGMKTPYNLRSSPVFPEIKSDEYMPVIIEAKEWLVNDCQMLGSRLQESDGLMVVVTSTSLEAVELLQKLVQRAVPGFSESGGFLGWCWPSQLHAIAARMSDAALAELMGESILGFVFRGPLGDSCLQAIAKKELLVHLESLGFE